jgi:hypothetical protein
LQFQNLWIN